MYIGLERALLYGLTGIFLKRLAERGGNVQAVGLAASRDLARADIVNFIGIGLGDRSIDMRIIMPHLRPGRDDTDMDVWMSSFEVSHHRCEHHPIAQQRLCIS